MRHGDHEQMLLDMRLRLRRSALQSRSSPRPECYFWQKQNYAWLIGLTVARFALTRWRPSCGYLAWILLLGLALNALTSWWWIDSVASLAIVPLLVREAREALSGKSCSRCGNAS